MPNKKIQIMKLFTKATIVVFSIIGSTFFGALLFSDNLKQVEKSKFIASTIIFSIIWTIGINKVIAQINLPVPFLSLVVTNFVGGLILVGPIWNYHIGKDVEYEKRSIWGPLLSLIALGAAIIGMFLWVQSR
jgi:hypothetical protein